MEKAEGGSLIAEEGLIVLGIGRVMFLSAELDFGSGVYKPRY